MQNTALNTKRGKFARDKARKRDASLFIPKSKYLALPEESLLYRKAPSSTLPICKMEQFVVHVDDPNDEKSCIMVHLDDEDPLRILSGAIRLLDGKWIRIYLLDPQIHISIRQEKVEFYATTMYAQYHLKTCIPEYQPLFEQARECGSLCKKLKLHLSTHPDLNSIWKWASLLLVQKSSLVKFLSTHRRFFLKFLESAGLNQRPFARALKTQTDAASESEEDLEKGEEFYLQQRPISMNPSVSEVQSVDAMLRLGCFVCPIQGCNQRFTSGTSIEARKTAIRILIGPHLEAHRQKLLSLLTDPQRLQYRKLTQSMDQCTDSIVSCLEATPAAPNAVVLSNQLGVGQWHRREFEYIIEEKPLPLTPIPPNLLMRKIEKISFMDSNNQKKRALEVNGTMPPKRAAIRSNESLNVAAAIVPNPKMKKEKGIQLTLDLVPFRQRATRTFLAPLKDLRTLVFDSDSEHEEMKNLNLNGGDEAPPLANANENSPDLVLSPGISAMSIQPTIRTFLLPASKTSLTAIPTQVIDLTNSNSSPVKRFPLQSMKKSKPIVLSDAPTRVHHIGTASRPIVIGDSSSTIIEIPGTPAKHKSTIVQMRMNRSREPLNFSSIP